MTDGGAFVLVQQFKEPALLHERRHALFNQVRHYFPVRRIKHRLKVSGRQIVQREALLFHFGRTFGRHPDEVCFAVENSPHPRHNGGSRNNV